MKKFIDLEAFRKAHGLTQLDIANSLQCQPLFISRLETGKLRMQSPTFEKLIKLYKHMEIEKYVKENEKGRVPIRRKLISIDNSAFNLKAYRTENNLTQVDIATAIECTPPFVSQIENRRAPFPQTAIEKLRTAFPDTDVNKYLSSEMVTSGKTESEIPKEQSVSILDRMMQLSEQMLTIQVQMSHLQTENYRLKQENECLKVANQRLTDYNERLKSGDRFKKEDVTKVTA
jgi:transcriptional regulator with XRE-family HTH domain